MSKIKRLIVNNFRGVIQESLDLDGSSVVILGENGTGKSSFIDAIEYYFTGKVSHLEGVQSISTTKHAPHILADKNQTSIAIDFMKSNLSAARKFNDAIEIPEGLKELHTQGSSTTFILRRKNLLDFILAQPASKYEQLAAIIGVDELDKTERSLMQVQDETGSEVENLIAVVETEKAKLGDLIGKTDFSDKDMLVAINKKLQELQQKPLESFSSANERKLQIVTGGHSPADLARSVQLQNLITQCQELSKGADLFESNKFLWDLVGQLHSDIKKVRDVLFGEVLKSSSRLIGQYNDIENCPVCLQPIKRQELLEALEKRVANLQPIVELSEKIKKQIAVFKDVAKNWIDTLNNVKKISKEIIVNWDFSPLDGYQDIIEGIIAKTSVEPADLQLDSLEKIKALPAIPAAFKSTKELIDAIQKEKAKLDPTEEDKKALQAIDLITRTLDSHQTLSTLNPILNTKRSTFKEISFIYETFVNTKRIEVQRIYSELQDNIREFFTVLHPNEGYKGVRLEVNEGKRASTEIKMDFHNRIQEDPRAFNSEGHLDSLGLCVFLAFVKRFNVGFPIIALDDVVSSIDSGHRQRVCDLLFGKFPDAQWFITTHDYVWHEELRAYLIAHGLAAQFKNLQILSWTLEEGPKFNIYKPRWVLIAEKIGGGDKDGAAASIRKELEAFLLEAVISLQARVPIKRDGRYTAGDLHDPLVSQFNKKVPAVFKEKEEVFTNLRKNGIFGNLLTHNNPQAGNTSIEEVRGFADAVSQFENVFICPVCNTMAIYYQDAKIIRCKCKEKGILWVTKD